MQQQQQQHFVAAAPAAPVVVLVGRFASEPTGLAGYARWASAGGLVGGLQVV